MSIVPSECATRGEVEDQVTQLTEEGYTTTLTGVAGGVGGDAGGEN